MPPKFPIQSFDTFKSLPLQEFEKQRYSIFVIDYDWNYLYANAYVSERLKGISIVNRNVRQIWQDHKHLNFQPLYNMVKNPVANHQPLSLKTHSPITNNSIEISGYPLDDCYFFTVSELPEKNSLLSELKSTLKK
jgi:hypothetical protein